MWQSAFFIFFFEKNISDGFEARDFVPEAQTLLWTPISGDNDHYGPNGHLAIWSIMAIFTIMAI